MGCTRLKAVALSLVLLAGVTEVRGELTPVEVGVIAMADDDESREVAAYYAKARGIPEANLLLLAGKPGTSVSRAVWEDEIRPTIRRWLSDSPTAFASKGIESFILPKGKRPSSSPSPNRSTASSWT